MLGGRFCSLRTVSSPAFLSAGAPRAGEAQAWGGAGAGGLCKFSLCLPTCSGVSCLDQEKDPDANQFINWPEHKELLAAPKWQLRKECKAFACGKHSSWETLDKHCLSP